MENNFAIWKKGEFLGKQKLLPHLASAAIDSSPAAPPADRPLTSPPLRVPRIQQVGLCHAWVYQERTAIQEGSLLPGTE